MRIIGRFQSFDIILDAKITFKEQNLNYLQYIQFFLQIDLEYCVWIGPSGSSVLTLIGMSYQITKNAHL